jgi:hypothetical protein
MRVSSYLYSCAGGQYIVLVHTVVQLLEGV